MLESELIAKARAYAANLHTPPLARALILELVRALELRADLAADN